MQVDLSRRRRSYCLGMNLIRAFLANEKFKLFIGGISFDYRLEESSAAREMAAVDWRSASI